MNKEPDVEGEEVEEKKSLNTRINNAKKILKINSWWHF